MQAKSRLLAKMRTKRFSRLVAGSTFDITTLIMVLSLSLVGSVWLHIPPALATTQVLFGLVIVRFLLVQGSHSRLALSQYTFWQAAFAGVTIYASYLFFFLRHYFSPRFLTNQNPITMRATTVSLLVLVVCQIISFGLAAPKKLRPVRLGFLGLLLLTVTYVPLLQEVFMTRALTLLDWLCIAMAGVFYASLCLLQQFSHAHSRREVIELHRKSV